MWVLSEMAPLPPRLQMAVQWETDLEKLGVTYSDIASKLMVVKCSVA